MSKRSFLIVGGLLGLVVIGAVSWYLASPLLFDRTVDETLPFEIPSAEELAQMPEAKRKEMEAEVMETAAAMPDKAMDEAMPASDQPVVLQRGQFVDIDNLHKGSGTATVLQLSDGSRILRFEDFAVTNGPDLHVLLASAGAPTSRDDLGEYVDLGALKGNKGNQNYEIPASVSLEAYQSIVIYCKPFHVVFSTATLSP